eukprot:CAMPEP_0194213312 /NCGR_PEP_ID=MMETSP0156-20130528/13768_1 /TAXON_ID=33649 /ORGANISM="Thalassionema nitzschioides, Strain L26-B" /LENGTH=288 /DNA_ID=CAMNT_0038941305 /DNA_START=12 /DNA_END=874 /DNA_ORIENTATION=-
MVRSIILFLLPISCVALSSIAIPNGNSREAAISNNNAAATTDLPTDTARPWRVALNFGRESLTPFWNSWGKSGARLPIVVPCDFCSTNLILPQCDTVSYTDLDGAETKAISGGDWSVDKEKHILKFSLTLPEQIEKRDIVLQANSQLTMEGIIYSEVELQELNQAFIDARAEEWKAAEVLDKIQKIRDAPKTWNEEKGVWEKVYYNEPLSSLASKNLNVFRKAQERKRRDALRPSPKDLSLNSGNFPGFDCKVFLGATNGIIRDDKSGMVVGSWTAEPITVTSENTKR